MNSVELPSGEAMMLGRTRPAVLPTVPLFRSYLLRDAPVPPPSIDYSSKAIVPLSKVYLNNQLGCCVISGKMHQIGLWSGADNEGPAVVFTDQDVVRYYGIIGGYRPGQPWTDRGCSIVDALNYLRSVGFNGHKIAGYVGVDNTAKIEVQVCQVLFGSMTLGLNLPNSWIQSARPGAVWNLAPANPNNGHDVCTVGYDAVGVQVCTWGMVLTIAWPAFFDRTIVEECYAEVGLDWTGTDQRAPSGVMLQQLMADLQLLGGGQIPPLPQPDPVPPPLPPVPAGPYSVVLQSDTPIKVVT